LEKQKHLADSNGRKIMLEFIEVEEFKELEESEDVYDIEVEGNHNFFANGLLVHNCQHLVNQHLIEASKRTGAPLIVTCDSHYSRPEHWREREIYKAMAWMNIQKDGFDKDTLPKNISELKCELYPKNALQVWDSYKETTSNQTWNFYDDQAIKDAIERTHDIAHNQLSEVHPDRSVKLPALHRIVGLKALNSLYDGLDEDSVDEDTVAFKALKEKAIEGLIWRQKQDSQVYIDRLRHELEVVKHLKFSKYFLTYFKIMSLLGEKMLLGPGRGSAAGSLLSYVLNITQIDPVKNGLLFERFLTRFKVNSFPDVDSDISNRDEALDILVKFFGQQNVVPVSNFTQLQMRSLIKDVCKLDGISFEEANAYTKEIEIEARNEAKKEPGFDAAQWVLSFEEAYEKSQTFRKLMETYPAFEKTIKVLFKQNRNISRHAGGVIITEDAFKNMPVIKSGGVLQTPWPEGLNYRHLEEFGFLKFDILGLGTLRMIEDTIRKILKKQGHKYVTFEQIRRWYYDNLHTDNNSMDDINVYKHVYWESNYAGVFQFVSKPVQKFVSKMKPRCINDISIATSLFRPGPLSISADKNYLKNRKNPKNIKYLHPLLEECLSDTAGLIVYQEQLQLIYHKLAGVPLDETDNIRKAFTKKEVANREAAAESRNKLREEFATRCLSVNSIDKKTSYAIFDDMEKYVKYSFNKSHAISYATVSYQSAWLLHYYPDEWITTYIDYSTTEKGKIVGKEDPKAVALTEALTLGYTIGKPDINLSEREFTVKDKVLIPSFASLKHCGKSVTEEIFKNRPYKKIEDLVFTEDGESWRHSKFNKRALGTLIKIGAFDSMDLVGTESHHTFKNYKQMYEVLVDNGDELKKIISRKKDRNHKERLQELIEGVELTEDWSLSEKIEFSKSLTGSVDLGLIVTPEIRVFFHKNNIASIDDWQSKEDHAWAVINSSKVAVTKTGKKYLRASIYGESGATHNCFMWSFREGKDIQPAPNTLVLCKFDKSDFGFSCWFGGLEVLEKK
jgi:DNA polymerase III subunit alpha